MTRSTLEWEGTDGASANAAVMSGDGDTWTSASSATYTASHYAYGSTSVLAPFNGRLRIYKSWTGAFHTRQFFWLPTAPVYDLCIAWGAGGTAGICSAIIRDNRSVALVNNTATDTLWYDEASSSYKAASSANAVPTGEWVRIECKIDPSGSTLKMWTTSGSGVYSTGTPDVSLSVGGSGGTFGTINLASYSYHSGAEYQAFTSGNNIKSDEWGWDSSTAFTAPPSGDAAATLTASATAAATRIAVVSAPATLTATAAANAGLLLTALGTPSISAVGSADASVITTHDAEAASTITVSTADAANLTRAMVAASTITATASATAALDGGADAAVQAIGAASIRIDGETSPGFLYATVSKHILTN